MNLFLYTPVILKEGVILLRYTQRQQRHNGIFQLLAVTHVIGTSNISMELQPNIISCCFSHLFLCQQIDRASLASQQRNTNSNYVPLIKKFHAISFIMDHFLTRMLNYGCPDNLRDLLVRGKFRIHTYTW